MLTGRVASSDASTTGIEFALVFAPSVTADPPTCVRFSATVPVIVVEASDTIHGEVDCVTATVPVTGTDPEIETGCVTPLPSTGTRPETSVTFAPVLSPRTRISLRTSGEPPKFTESRTASTDDGF